MPTHVGVEEGGITATYALSLNSEPAASVVISIATDGQTVVEPVSVAFDLTNWDEAQQVVVAAVDDADVEGTHASTISHNATSADGNYDGIAIVDVVADITDDDVAPPLARVQFGSDVYSAKETAGLANIAVTLDVSSSLPVTVTFASQDGTATGGEDYGVVSGTLRFDVGQMTQAFAVPVLGDTALEGDETVRLVLSAPVHAVLGVPSEAILTIVDNTLLLPCVMRDSGG
jgi:hypothetical protein